MTEVNSPTPHAEHKKTNPHLISPPRRLRAGTATNTAGVPAALLQPFLRAQAQFTVELIARVLSVNEIAESTTHTAFSTI